MRALILLSLFVSLQAWALDFRLESNHGLSLEEENLAKEIMQESLNLLPDSMKSTINKSITVKFLGSKDDRITMVCQSDSEHPTTKFLGQTTYTLGKQVISLNRGFLNGTNESYPCRHQNLRSEAIATLVHETAHVFENILKDKHQPRPSKGQQFRNLVFHMKNKLSERSPDPYEFSSLAESFAVNFEYFIMDPEYKCRKPTLWHYYSELLDTSPSNAVCEDEAIFKLGTNGKFVSFNKKRVYQVEYLMAAAGKALMSRFGHAMVRLVVCSPYRKTVGPECLKDISHHIVLSYRANTGASTNYIKGLLGKYPSQLFAVPFSKVMDEYNRQEFRDLIAYPLQYTREQIDLFIEKSLEAHWSYSGKYFFVQNNCAVETNRLITSVLPGNHPQKKNRPLTPKGVRKDYLQTGLILPAPQISQKNTGIIHFPTQYKEDLEGAFERILPLLVNTGITNLKSYEEKTTAEQRATWFGQSDKSLKTRMAFFIIEQKISKDMNEKVGKALNQLMGSKALSLADKEFFDSYLKLQNELSPWKMLHNNFYGIPKKEEIDTQLAEETQKRFHESNIQAIEVLQHYMPELASEFHLNSENLTEFFKGV